MEKKTKKLNALSKAMKDKGFDVRMAYINRLRILDCKLDNFKKDSNPIKTSMHAIANQTYEEMYEHPSVNKGEIVSKEIKASRFEQIFDALEEFCGLSHEERISFIEKKRRNMKFFEFASKNIIDDMRGRA